MAVSDDQAASTGGTFSSGKRWVARLGTAISVLLSLYILLVVNVIIYRHPMRIDLTEEGLHRLSPETRTRLDLLHEEIRVVVPHFQQPRNARHAAEIRVLSRALNLLKEYNLYQPRVRLLAQVNVYSEPDRWQQLCRKHDLAPNQVNRMIFMAGEGDAFRQVVTPSDLAAFSESRDPVLPPEVTSFRGEEAMTAAIVRLMERDRKKVYFTTGHGELSLSARGGRPADLGALRHDLDGSGFEALELALAQRARVPDDCRLLVIAGPTQRFTEDELDRIERYLLVEEGRLLVTLSGERTGIETLLEGWGVRVRTGEIHTRLELPGQRLDQSEVVVRQLNQAHPITAPLREAAGLEIRLYGPQPLSVEGGQARLRTDVLIATGPDSGSVRYRRVGAADVDEEGEAPGRQGFVLATATREERLERPPPDWVQRRTRVVVVGASSFLRDAQDQASVRGGYLSASHRDFFVNCVQWLVGDERRIAISGRASRERKLPPLQGSLRRFLFLSSVLIFPGIFLAVGIAITFLRRS